MSLSISSSSVCATLVEPRFGITHRGRGIAVDRAEIALPVDQRHAHGEILRHPHQRVIDRLVAVRVIFTDDVADGAGRLAVRLVPVEAVLVHRVENAPMHRLQTVARIRQRTRHDHAHGVIEVGALHLVEDGNGTNIGRRRRLSGLRIFRFRQGKIRSIQNQVHIAHRGGQDHLKRARAQGFSLRFSRRLRERAWHPRMPPEAGRKIPSRRAV